MVLVVQCLFVLVTKNGEGFQHHLIMSSTYLGYIAPILPIMISCGVSVYKLKSSKPHSGQQVIVYQGLPGIIKKKRYATITLILFTMVYIVFNVPLCVIYIIQTISDHTGNNIFSFEYPNFYFTNFIHTLSVPLNSALNPVIYYYRMKNFRNKINNLF